MSTKPTVSAKKTTTIATTTAKTTKRFSTSTATRFATSTATRKNTSGKIIYQYYLIMMYLYSSQSNIFT